MVTFHVPSIADTCTFSGGGVGGLACAVALSRYEDIQIDIYEAAEKFAEIGAGIGMWPRTWKIMRKLGIDTDLAKVAIVAPDSQSSMQILYWGDTHLLRLF